MHNYTFESKVFLPLFIFMFQRTNYRLRVRAKLKKDHSNYDKSEEIFGDWSDIINVTTRNF